MRDLGIPNQITRWLKTKFEGRTTTLNFEDYTSDPFDIKHGLDQGCPLSPILFNYYTAKLIRVSRENDSVMATYVDDVFDLTSAETVDEALEKQKDIEMRKDGFQDWKRTHACEVEISKDGLIIFTPHRSNQRAKSLKLGTKEIEPKEQVKYLGVIIDKGLKWKEHTNYAIGKGIRTVAALKRLGKQTKGIPPEYICEDYT